MSESKEKQSIEALEDKFQTLYKEYSKKIRKLERCQRSANARAYVQQRLKEEAALQQKGVDHIDSVPAKQMSSRKKKLTGACSSLLKSHVLSGETRSSVGNGSVTMPVNRQLNKKQNVLVENVCQADQLYGADSDFVKNKDISEIVKCSQDIFTSPGNSGNSESENFKPDQDKESDVIIVGGDDERYSAKCRNTGNMSKLKLSKYKNKNLVTPVAKKIEVIQTAIDIPPEPMFLLGNSNITKPALNSTLNCDNKEKLLKITADNTCLYSKANIESTCNSNDEIEGDKKSNSPAWGEVIHKSQENKENIYSRHSLQTKETDGKIEKGRIISQEMDNTGAEPSAEPQSLFSFTNENSQLDTEQNCARKRRKSGSRKRHMSAPCLQRRSSRIAGQSSEETDSQNTESDIQSPLFMTTNHSSAKKRVIISSVFQCLVDEGRRNNNVEEFSVPADILYSGSLDKCHHVFEPSVHLQRHINTTAVCTGDMDTQKYKTKSRESKHSENNADCTLEPMEHSELTLETKESTLPSIETDNYADQNEKEEIRSPTLFESQPDAGAFTYNDDVKKVKIGSCDSNEELNGGRGGLENDICGNLCNLETNPNNDVCPSADESFMCLQQTGCFQVPKSDNVQAVLCVEKMCNECIQTYVVCLCSSSLQLYTTCNNEWTCVASTKLGYISKKKSSSMMYSIPSVDSVSLILIGSKSDSTCINVYTYIQHNWQHTTLDTLISKSIQVCPVSSQRVVVSYYKGEMTHLCIYHLDSDNGQWSSKQLGRTEAQVAQLVSVKGIDAAVLAMTKTSHIQIWNHENGYLLSTVDISDICPPDPVCPTVVSEQGFLFLPLLTRKKSTSPGCVVVINPSMASSEALTPIDLTDLWTGCSHVCVMSEGLMLGRQSNGCVRLWNVYNGDLLATIDDVTVTCFSGTNLICAIAHKQCIHVYDLKHTV